jgi:hypothetical protein
MSGFDFGLRKCPNGIAPEAREKLESRNSIDLSEKGISVAVFSRENASSFKNALRHSIFL